MNDHGAAGASPVVVTAVVRTTADGTSVRLRGCISCGRQWADTDIEPCRGERKDPPWCNGDHNCPFCRLYSDLMMMLAGRQGGYGDKFGPDAATVAWFDALPDEHPVKVAVLWDHEHADERLDAAMRKAKEAHRVQAIDTAENADA